MQFNIFFQNIFRYTVSKRGQVILIFKLLYGILLVLFYFGSKSVFYADNNLPFFYSLAVVFGKAAVVVYILTLFPGIVRRFLLKHQIVTILMMYRRYLGILMYMLIFIHYWWIRGISNWFHKIFILPPPVFERLGLISLILLTPMVFTSTDLAVAKLGIWWGRIHKLTHVAMFLIFMHLALQRFSVWSIMILTILVLQIVSYNYSRLNQWIKK